MKDNDLAQVVLIANSRLLGFLREQVPSRLQERIAAVFEEDAIKKNVDELRGLLVRRGLVVARRASASRGARSARSQPN
jgi:protein required for attachment to host cells